MAEECDLSGVGRDLAEMLRDARRPGFDRVVEFAAPVVTVNPVTQRIASRLSQSFVVSLHEAWVRHP